MNQKSLWVLIGAVLTNLGRVVTGAVLAIREGRDLDAYLNAVFATSPNFHIGWENDASEAELYDWERALLGERELLVATRPETD